MTIKPTPAPPGSDPQSSERRPAIVTLAHRIRRMRQSLGFSVRAFAEKAGISKDTVVKLEKGNTPSYSTLCRVCDALGVSVVHLLHPGSGVAAVALHRRTAEQRVPHGDAGAQREVKAPKGKPRKTAKLRTADAHQVLAADDKVLLSWLACRLPGGAMNSWLLELRGPTEPTTHSGEEFVFCLRGQCRVTVAGSAYELDAGDCMTFWSAEAHNYAPALPLEAEDPSVLLLSVWTSHEDSARSGARRRSAKPEDEP